jgi:5'-nucleotidase
LSSPLRHRRARTAVAAVGLGLVVSPLASVTAADAASGSHLVISEVYGGGGNSNATYNADFVELFNPTDAAVSLDGLGLQYRSASGGSGGVAALKGSVPAGDTFLIRTTAPGSTGADLPTPDLVSPTTLNMSGSTGQVLLMKGTTAFSGSGDVAGNPALVDMVGFGKSPSTYETAPTGTDLTNQTSAQRSADGTDSDSNRADFVADTPTPDDVYAPAPPPEEFTGSIADIQGTGDASPHEGDIATTRGVVTAAYPTGGYKGFYIQTPGTGGDVDTASHDASDGLFVYLGGAAASAYPRVGDYVQVTGPVSEYYGLTQVSARASDVTRLDEAAGAPKPARVAYPATDAERESLEGMLLEPQGDYTVTDNYALNQYAEIGLAAGTEPLRQPTDVARPGTPAAADVEADNAARAVKLDDGATTNFFTASNQDIPLPYLTTTRSIRVGAAATFTKPVVLDYRNSSWKFEPTSQLTADDADSVQPVTFEDTRTAAPESVGGRLKIASFNVLNYFVETGEEYVADGGTCSFYTDRDGNKITVRSCNGEGPRGAANDENLERQQAKIVKAINALDADVLSLEEIENSAKYAGESRRDDALAALVDALNADAGSEVWDYVRSPQERPALSDEDVIRTAFIYHKDAVEPVGPSRILIGSDAFHNARKPLAQVFRPRVGTDRQKFLVVVNHFKSKGSGVDDGTGQGNSNPDRVAQAHALVDFVDEVKQDTGVRPVFLTGDFNAYTQEDPMHVLYDAGYTDIGSAKTDESTYLYGGVVGSLDHVLANPTAFRRVTGADVWNINSVEPVALEYSRYNYNATNFYEVSPFRSSDHDPLVVGYAPAATGADPAARR